VTTKLGDVSPVLDTKLLFRPLDRVIAFFNHSTKQIWMVQIDTGFEHVFHHDFDAVLNTGKLLRLRADGCNLTSSFMTKLPPEVANFSIRTIFSSLDKYLEDSTAAARPENPFQQ
jgi:hypothetical protein